MHDLEAVRNANKELNLSSPVAVILGASGNSIGASLACKLAEYSTKPEIHLVSRSQSSADPVIDKLRSINPEGQYTFHPCDASLITNVKALASSLNDKLPKLNYLVLSSGLLTMQGRTETPDGHDYKMMLHYYTRMNLLNGLTGKLDAAAEAGEPARAVSVLDATRSNPSKLNLEDLELKKTYSLKGAADHCVGQTDVYLDHLSKRHPKVSFIHAYPGFVGTDIGRGMPGPLWSVFTFISKPFLTSSADCAEYLFYGSMARKETQTGVHSLDNKGNDVTRPQFSEDVSKKVVEHTNSLLNI